MDVTSKLKNCFNFSNLCQWAPEHYEMLFIIIHQVYELWFKQILHELEKLKSSFQKGERGKALHTLKRIRSILKVLVSQVDVLETMTPLEFLSLRERLQSASGFQSCQFRELEFTLGLKNPKHLEQYPQGSEERNRLEKKWRNLLYGRFSSNFFPALDMIPQN